MSCLAGKLIVLCASELKEAFHLSLTQALQNPVGTGPKEPRASSDSRPHSTGEETGLMRCGVRTLRSARNSELGARRSCARIHAGVDEANRVRGGNASISAVCQSTGLKTDPRSRSTNCCAPKRAVFSSYTSPASLT